ncbi:MAG: hypothetical protein ACLFN5_00205 [bacterium]
MSPIKLTRHEYCAEDDTYTLQGQSDERPDLDSIARRAEAEGHKVINMKNLNTVVVITEGPTIHFHGNGKIVVNSARDEKKVKKMLAELLA